MRRLIEIPNARIVMLIFNEKLSCKALELLMEKS